MDPALSLMIHIYRSPYLQFWTFIGIVCFALLLYSTSVILDLREAEADHLLPLEKAPSFKSFNILPQVPPQDVFIGGFSAPTQTLWVAGQRYRLKKCQLKYFSPGILQIEAPGQIQKIKLFHPLSSQNLTLIKACENSDFLEF